MVRLKSNKTLPNNLVTLVNKSSTFSVTQKTKEENVSVDLKKYENTTALTNIETSKR